MDVHVLSALADNYMYVIVDKSSQEAAVVDPFDASKVAHFVRDQKLNLTTVLTTHHHMDHAGGNVNLSKEVSGLKVVGGDARVDAVNHIVKHGDRLIVGQLQVDCLLTPCHTSGHTCYKVSSQDGEIALFTGDTLFIGGCGRFFEGTAEQMYTALLKIIGALPDYTKIYCGHEYTLNNLKFAKHVEPNNPEVDKKLEFAQKCKDQKMPTVPSTLAEEKLFNPFMRVHEPSVQQHAKQNDPIQTMDVLRTEKNNFK